MVGYKHQDSAGYRLCQLMLTQGQERWVDDGIQPTSVCQQKVSGRKQTQADVSILNLAYRTISYVRVYLLTLP
jgi:hypothetical protein